MCKSNGHLTNKNALSNFLNKFLLIEEYFSVADRKSTTLFMHTPNFKKKNYFYHYWGISYVPREPRRDSSDWRLYGHGIWYISGTARVQTRNQFHHKSAPIPLGHTDQSFRSFSNMILLTMSHFHAYCAHHLTQLPFSKSTSHVFPVVSKQGYTNHYLVTIAMLRRQSLWLAKNYYH